MTERTKRVRFAVVGAGAVGGYFGGRLAEAGYDVTFIARGRTLDALRSQGLVVKSLDGDFSRAVKAHRRPGLRRHGGLRDLRGQGVANRGGRAGGPTALRGGDFRLAPAQRHRGAVPAGRRAGASSGCSVGSAGSSLGVEAPGSIHHFGARPTIELGELDGSSSERTEAFRQAAERAGIACQDPRGGHPDSHVGQVHISSSPPVPSAR